MREAKIELPFPARWRAEILPTRPLILPPRRFVYPQAVDEVERGALEVMVFPAPDAGSPRASRHTAAEPFLATCALGFQDPMTPTGVWSCPRAEEICLVAGGYAYMVPTDQPAHFQMLEMRPVLEVRAAVQAGLLLFVGHRTLMAWGPTGLCWQTPPVSDEGITITALEYGVLHGLGWQMRTDREQSFTVELASGAVHSN